MSNNSQITMLKVILEKLRDAEWDASMSQFDNLSERIHEVSCLVELELDDLEKDK